MYQTDCIQFSKFLPKLANKSCEYLLGFEAEMMLVVFLHTDKAGNLYSIARYTEGFMWKQLTSDKFKTWSGVGFLP